MAGSPSEWRRLSRVVGGRIVNGYCTTDWLLKFLYRTMSAQFSIAGTGPIERTGERKILNVNLSHIVRFLRSFWPFQLRIDSATK